MMANSITAKLLTLAVAGKGQAEAGNLEFFFLPGRLAVLIGNLLYLDERNLEGISAGPAISHSGYKSTFYSFRVPGIRQNMPFLFYLLWSLEHLAVC